jgi:trehalose 6-phosphate synthase/phosphatase
MPPVASERLLIVSNRLPVIARLDAGELRLADAEGGLARGLRPWHMRSGGLWLGWPGDVSPFAACQRTELDLQLQQRGIVPVHLSKDQIDRYYHRFSNGVLWPLFHYLVDRVPVDTVGWDAYREVNEAFADAVVDVYTAGDLIWVHDYQLMLLPALLRERLPEARIGFFLHIPFPSSEVFRILPWRRQLLQGLLGADLIGFHTFAYLRHFVASLLHVDGVEANVDTVRVGSRDVALGVFPMGVDAAAFTDLARDPQVAAAAEAIRHEAGGRRVILGIDRLDYTKGIPRRLIAIERLLAREPSLRDTIRYVQVAVPSRAEVESYQRFRHQVEEMVGRINGACATLRSTPIHYMHRSISTRELVSLYLAADVMLVTPLRDGMNLVAKEFVASRVDEQGVLVLSEFAGAAAELGDVVAVNPYDVEGIADGIQRALAMPSDERRRRMRSLRTRVMAYDVHAWADTFVAQLSAAATGNRADDGATCPFAAALDAAKNAAHLHVLLDYDGTLVPFADAPELAVPDAELLQLLATLAECDGVAVQLVSGRPRAWLAEWFGHLPLVLWAEHGYWHRSGDGAPWHAAAPAMSAWMSRVMPILEQFTSSTPGSRIERKDASLAWHYRQADPEFGARQAHELRMLLGDALSNQPLEVLEGNKVIEIRVRGISKAAVAHRSLFHDDAVVAIGDDQTDEDLFNALPPSAITIAAGSAPTAARYRVADYRAVRELLWALVLARRTMSADPAEAVH